MTTNATHLADDATTTQERVTPFAARALAALRIAFGLTFLWAFFDKLFALGFATGRSVNPETGADRRPVRRRGLDQRRHPTEGFLKFGADGPFKGIYNDIAGATWADWLFMLGLFGIGIALLLGIGMRIATTAGALLYVLMWTVVLPPENNPVLDDHILGAITLIALGALHAGNTWGLGKVWSHTDYVQSHPVLR